MLGVSFRLVIWLRLFVIVFCFGCGFCLFSLWLRFNCCDCLFFLLFVHLIDVVVLIVGCFIWMCLFDAGVCVLIVSCLGCWIDCCSLLLLCLSCFVMINSVGIVWYCCLLSFWFVFYCLCYCWFFIVVWCCSLIGYGGCLYLFVLLVGLVLCV